MVIIVSCSTPNRELKQTDAAAANLQISIQKDSRPSEFSRPLTSITLNLNRDLPVDRRRVSLLKLPNISDLPAFPYKLVSKEHALVIKEFPDWHG